MKFIGKFFKFIFKTILWLLLIAVVLVVILYLASGKLIQHFGPTLISHVTQTETALGEVDISLFKGHIALNKLAIGNPVGFKDKNLFEVGQFVVDFNPKSVLTDKIVVDQVKISGVQIGLEMNAQGKTNATALLDNINQSLGAEKSQVSAAEPVKEPTESASSEPAKSVVIRDLTISDSTVRTGIAGQMVTLSLPNIHQTNIGEQKKVSLMQAALDIYNTLMAESTKTALKATKQALSDGLEATKGSMNDLTSGLKNLFK